MAASLASDRYHKAAQALECAQSTIIEFVLAWLTDDPAGWAGLFDLFDRPLRCYLLGVCRRPDEVYDLAMKTWLKARDGLPTYDPSQPFDRWLFRIGFNVYMDFYRSEKSAGCVSMPTEESPVLSDYSSPGPDTPLCAGCSAADLHLALEHIPPVQAYVSFQHHGYGASFEELGRELKRDPHTVASDDVRARRHLRDLLAKPDANSGALKRPANP